MLAVKSTLKLVLSLAVFHYLFMKESTFPVLVNIKVTPAGYQV